MSELDRRTFLKASALGAATVSLPGALAACASARHGQAPATALSLPAAADGTRYFERFGVDTALLQRVIARGVSRGGGYCEVFLQHRISHFTALEDGEVNRAFTTVDLGAGIRVINGDATGYAFSEDLSEGALLKAAAIAASVASGSPTVTPRALSAAATPDRYPCAVPWSTVGVERKLPIILRAEQAARRRDSRIVKVKVTLGDEAGQIVVADSDGRLCCDAQPMALLSVLCVAKKGERTESSWQSGSGRDGLAFFSDERVDRVAREAAEFTVMLFDASPPPPGEYPVVLAPGLSGILLHEAIGHGLEADFNRKGTSIYAGRIGQRIAPPAVTIVDDGTSPRARGSINIDDEGASAERTVLVEQGVLRSYMHDWISARHFKVGRTGSGRRESFRFPPQPRMRNTYMLDGSRPPEEIIASVKKGLYAEMFANGEVHIGPGDFTFYLKHGRLIEDGKLTRVVKDANLIGSGPKVLETVDLVGNDLQMFSGAGYCGKGGQRVPVGFGLPTIRCRSISVGGRSA